MIMPLDMGQLITNLQKCPKKGFPKHDYSIACIKLMLFYMFSYDLSFNSFMKYLKGPHEITPYSPLGYLTGKKIMTFDKKSELSLIGASIFTIMYRSNMVVRDDDLAMKIGLLPKDDVNTFLGSFVKLVNPSKPVFYQKVVIDILLEWCYTETQKTFNQFWFDKMNYFIDFLINMMRIPINVKFDANIMSIIEINDVMQKVYCHICNVY
jgi:hypothetical protein